MKSGPNKSQRQSRPVRLTTTADWALPSEGAQPSGRTKRLVSSRLHFYSKTTSQLVLTGARSNALRAASGAIRVHGGPGVRLGSTIRGRHAASPVISTETSNVDGVVNERMLRDVVMGGRGTFNWIIQTPGTFYGRGYQSQGSRIGAISHDLDGVAVEDPRGGRVYGPLRPDQEMIREVRMRSVNSPAEFGTSATIVQTTKNGTNDFHGQVSWNHINGALAARNFFSSQSPTAVFNNLFASADGPIAFAMATWAAHAASSETGMFRASQGQRPGSAALAMPGEISSRAAVTAG